MAIHEYTTKYGTIFHDSVCHDDWASIRTVTLGSRGRAETYTLQGPAIHSLRAVAKQLGGPFRMLPVKVSGTFRTCAYQMELWLSDKNRYAHPNSTLHTQGLAIDVDMNFLNAHPKVKTLLLQEGWHQSRPTDEPWHFSYRLTA